MSYRQSGYLLGVQMRESVRIPVSGKCEVARNVVIGGVVEACEVSGHRQQSENENRS